MKKNIYNHNEKKILHTTQKNANPMKMNKVIVIKSINNVSNKRLIQSPFSDILWHIYITKPYTNRFLQTSFLYLFYFLFSNLLFSLAFRNVLGRVLFSAASWLFDLSLTKSGARPFWDEDPDQKHLNLDAQTLRQNLD
jgi:hypothetical protein